VFLCIIQLALGSKKGFTFTMEAMLTHTAVLGSVIIDHCATFNLVHENSTDK
jgi:hypothetical protein